MKTTILALGLNVIVVVASMELARIPTCETKPLMTQAEVLEVCGHPKEIIVAPSPFQGETMTEWVYSDTVIGFYGGNLQYALKI